MEKIADCTFKLPIKVAMQSREMVDILSHVRKLNYQLPDIANKEYLYYIVGLMGLEKKTS